MVWPGSGTDLGPMQLPACQVYLDADADACQVYFDDDADVGRAFPFHPPPHDNDHYHDQPSIGRLG